MTGRLAHWDIEKRAALRAEIDAMAFLLYGLDYDDIEYVLGTFELLERRDVERYGNFRTREQVLMAFDALRSASTPAGVGASTAGDYA